MQSIRKYGLLTGFSNGLWGILSFSIVGWLNRAFFHQSIPATDIRSVSGLFSIFILVLGIYWGIRDQKRRNGEWLSYQQAIKTGILISLITAIIVSLFTLLYCAVLNPGYAGFMVSDAQRVLSAAGKTQEEINSRLESVRKEFSTGAQVAMAFIGQFVLGSISSFIIGYFLRSRK